MKLKLCYTNGPSPGQKHLVLYQFNQKLTGIKLLFVAFLYDCDTYDNHITLFLLRIHRAMPPLVQ